MMWELSRPERQGSSPAPNSAESWSFRHTGEHRLEGRALRPATSLRRGSHCRRFAVSPKNTAVIAIT